MKTIFILFLAWFLAEPSLFAKDLSVREKRLNAQNKNKFKIDKTVANTTAVDKTALDETRPEKPLNVKSPSEKTIRADKIGKKSVLTRVPVAKQRKHSYIREWP